MEHGRRRHGRLARVAPALPSRNTAKAASASVKGIYENRGGVRLGEAGRPLR